jgi:hypothetical protein
MAEIINLRTARKQAERQKNEKQAEANRLAHGIARKDRAQADASRDAANRLLDGHRRDDSGNDTGGGAA